MKDLKTLEGAISHMNEEKGPVFSELMRRGTMSVEYYAPKKWDRQKHHAKDEIYVIASGQATMHREGQRFICFTGDILFVAAGIDYRFENYSEDFSTWIIFFSSDGKKDSDQLT
jgi:mannose-6-phosphate isomerase-like protein (cupin superfamily)